MKRAIVTGVTGQDGAYLAELLLRKGYEVHGTKRRSSLFNTNRIDHLYEDPYQPAWYFVLHYGDLTDSSSLVQVVQRVEPDEIYNFAAQSHVKVSFEEPEYTANADALGTLRLLEAMRICGLEKSEPQDYVIATGEQHSVREFVSLAAGYLDIDITWRGEGAGETGSDQNGRVIVAVDPRYYRPTEVETLQGDAGKGQTRA